LFKVLFVCTGNICRSPTAEGFFRHKIREAGLDHKIETDSVGMHGWHSGEQPDHRAIKAAKRRGVALYDLRSREIRTSDFTEFDLILAMDRGHFIALKRRAPRETTAYITMFLDYASITKESDVPDPYYGNADDFEYVMDLVEDGVTGLIDRIEKDYI